MTLWSPRLQETPDPIYTRIADALERDVRAGVLLPGSQLPTHRRLAQSLGITAVTVTRAYAEAARRGLVASSTGRGTFVRAAKRAAAVTSEIDLATNFVNIPLPLPSASLLERIAVGLTTSLYGPAAGTERHRAAGAAWIGQHTDAARVVVTAGTQHGLFLAVHATTRPGDTVMTEETTYHGVKNVAGLTHVKLHPLPVDRYGLVPEAFAKACRARAGKVLYTIPTLHNPTAVVLPEARRREIASIAAKYGITIIEDDVCGFLLEKTPPPILSFAPDRTIFLTGLGKAIAPAMRVGYMAAPDALLPRLHAAVAASVLFTSPLLAEIAATWIEDGTAARIVAQKRSEVALRTRVARRVLPDLTGDARSLHLWLTLPKRWTADAFAEEARRRNVRVASASAFAVTADVPRAIRVSIGAPATAAELENALHVLAGIGEVRAEAVV